MTASVTHRSSTGPAGAVHRPEALVVHRLGSVPLTPPPQTRRLCRPKSSKVATKLDIDVISRLYFIPYLVAAPPANLNILWSWLLLEPGALWAQGFV